ncbi:DUF6916 family protein [Leifsonia sp. NPDC058194]|uniref:DUF6916 family protein n=1 Tax=Leifsonia sp. NPDC058194 TaxID=3346374 RepID=UPI0036DC22B9
MTATHADWAALAGSTVRATAADGRTHELYLAAVSDAHRTEQWVTYTLHFEGGPEVPVDQQTYELAASGPEGHAVAEPVFLVPSGRSGDGQTLTLEATFAQAAQEEN